jgi:hypothetical protein
MLRFLLTHFHLKSFESKTNIKGIKNALKNLPSDIDIVYEKAMKRIQDLLASESELALRVLSWITHAVRPLKVGEIQHAIAVMELEPGESLIGFEWITDEAELINVCGGVVIIDEESRVIRLAHYTNQEYFERKGAKWFHNVETEIATACVAYLSLDVFRSAVCHTTEEYEERIVGNPFFEYAATNWGYHTDNTKRLDPVLGQTILGFFGNQTNVNAAKQGLPTHKYSSSSIESIQLAAHLGCELAMKLLIDSGTANLESSVVWTKNWDETPLIMAIQQGHEGTVRLLLESGAKFDSDFGGYGMDLIVIAVDQDNVAVLRLLLERGNFGIDLNRPMEKFEDITVFAFACSKGHETIVKFLLETGRVEANIRDSDSVTPLARAVEDRDSFIVKVLLESNEVDTVAADNQGYSQLSSTWSTLLSNHLPQRTEWIVTFTSTLRILMV